jgi:hypothetical protein
MLAGYSNIIQPNTPLGFVPNYPLQPNGLFPYPIWWIHPQVAGDFDLASDRTATLLFGSGWPLLNSEERGAAFNYDGAQINAWPSYSGECAGSITLVMIWRRTENIGATYRSVICKRSARAEFGVNYNSGVYQWYWHSGGGYAATNLGVANIPALNEWSTTVYVRSVGNYTAAWDDGVLLQKNTGMTQGVASDPDPISTGGFGSGGGEQAAVEFAFAYILPLAVDDSDGAMLSVDPLAPFAPLGYYAVGNKAADAFNPVLFKRRPLAQLRR